MGGMGRGGGRGMEGKIKSPCLAKEIFGGRGEVEGLKIPQTHHFESFQNKDLSSPSIFIYNDKFILLKDY